MTESEKYTSLNPLPLFATKKIQELRLWAIAALEDCSFIGTKILDSRKALEILRSALVEEIDIRLGFYETLLGFAWEWNTDILAHASHSVLACFPNNRYEKRDENSVVIGYESSDQFLDELIKTGWDHAAIRRMAQGETRAPDALSDRRTWVKDYRAAFPEAKILDICWAARQHYSEWKRWLRSAVKDGSAPDRAFQAILCGSKSPSEYRKTPRPRGWK